MANSYMFPQNLVLIRLMVSEKTRFTDGRTTDKWTDVHCTALALVTQSSIANKMKPYMYSVACGVILQHVHAYVYTT